MPVLFVLLLFVQFAYSQSNVPSWINDNWRSASYPSEDWYIGFSLNNIKEQPDSKTYQEVERDAQNKLSESILAQIRGSTTTQTTSQQTQSNGNFKEVINRDYRQTIQTSSNIVLAKVDVKSYFDRKSGYIYGFAAVKKRDLADFYRGNINALFSFAEKELAIIGYLSEQGQKNQAFSRIQAVEDSLKNIGYWNSYLRAVESDNSYSEKERDFWQKINKVKMSLERSTTVFLDVQGVEQEQLAAQMQERNCNCTIAKSTDKADYVVRIRAKLSSCQENQNKFVYCYANADVSVNNLKFNKPLNIKIPEAKGGWTNRNKEKAIEETFKELTNSLAEKITQSINK